MTPVEKAAYDAAAALVADWDGKPRGTRAGNAVSPFDFGLVRAVAKAAWGEQQQERTTMEKTPEEQAVIDAAKQLLHYWERISFHAPANAIEHEFVKAVRAVRDLEAAAAGST